MKMKFIFSSILLLFSVVVFSQTFQEVKTNRLIMSGNGVLRPLRDTIQLNARDSGSIAFKNGQYYGWTGSKYAPIGSSLGGGSQSLQQVLDIGNTTNKAIIWDTIMTVAAPESSSKEHLLYQYKPLTRTADQVNFNTWLSATRLGNSVDEIYIQGWNIGSGGGSMAPGLPGLGESWESNYTPGTDRLVEKHDIYVNPAGQQRRLSSYTINTANDNVDFYHEVSRLYLKQPGVNRQYFVSEPSSVGAALQLGWDDRYYARFNYDKEVGAAYGLSLDLGGTPVSSFNMSNIALTRTAGLDSYINLTQFSGPFPTLRPQVHSSGQLGQSDIMWRKAFIDTIGEAGSELKRLFSKRIFTGTWFGNDEETGSPFNIYNRDENPPSAMHIQMDGYNSGTTVHLANRSGLNNAWYDNLLILSHQSTNSSLTAYGGLSGQGKSLIISQGAVSRGMILGTYDSDSIYVMTNNIPRMTISETGKIAVKAVPVNDDTLSQVIVRDYTTGELKYRNAVTIGGSSDSTTLDFPSTGAGASSDLTVTVTRAVDGDVVSLGVPNASITSNGGYFAWVSGTNTVTVRYFNHAGSAADPASGTFKVKVFK